MFGPIETQDIQRHHRAQTVGQNDDAVIFRRLAVFGHAAMHVFEQLDAALADRLALYFVRMPAQRALLVTYCWVKGYELR